MIQFLVEQQIERPREEVFRRLADIDAYSDWLPNSVIFRGGELERGSEVRLGTRYQEKTPIGTFWGEIVEYQPPAVIAFRTPMTLMGRGPVFESRPKYVLESTHAGTIVHHYAEGEFFGGWQMFEFAGRRLAHYERNRTVDALAGSFEATG